MLIDAMRGLGAWGSARFSLRNASALRNTICFVALGIGVSFAADAPDILWMRGGAGFQFSSLDISEDASLLVSGDANGQVKLWRSLDGLLVRTLEGHSNFVENVAFSRGAGLVASIDASGVLKLWRAGDGVQLWSVAAQVNNLNLVAFSPDGRTLATSGADAKVRLWKVEDGSLIRELVAHSQPVRGIDFSPDGLVLISASWDRSLILWRVEDGLILGSINTRLRGWSAAFSPDNNTVAVGESRQVQMWRVSDGALVHSLTNHPGNVVSLSYSQDGSTLAAGDTSGTVKLWNVSAETAEDIVTGVSPSAMIDHPVALAADGRTLAFNTADKKLKLWRSGVATGPATLSLYESIVTSVAFSPDGCLVATAGPSGPIQVFKAADGAVAGTIDYVSPVGGGELAFSPDGTLLATGDDTGQIRMWRVSDWQFKSQIAAHSPAAESISALVFSPDGSLIVSGGADAVVKIWRVDDGSLERSLAGHSDGIYTLVFSPQGDLLVSGGRDTTLKMWRMADGSLKSTLSGHTDWVLYAAFAADGTRVVSGAGDGTIRLWSVSDGINYQTLQDGFRVRGVEFSADGSHLVSAGASSSGLAGVLRVWRLSGGANIQTFTRELVYPTTFRVAPDRRLIAYGRYDGTVVVANNPLAPQLGPQLRLERSGTALLLHVTGVAGTNVTLQLSTDLTHWLDADHIANPPASLDLPLQLTNGVRFYRIVQTSP